MSDDAEDAARRQAWLDADDARASAVRVWRVVRIGPDWIEDVAQPLLAWLLFTSWCFAVAAFLGAFGLPLLERLSVWAPPSLAFGASLMHFDRTGKRDLLRYDAREWVVLLVALLLVSGIAPLLAGLPRLLERAAEGLWLGELLNEPLVILRSAFLSPLGMLRILLTVSAWLIGWSVARDLEQLSLQRSYHVPLDSAAYYAWLTSPERWVDHEAARQSLMRKFLAAGLVVVLLAGLGLQQMESIRLGAEVQVPVGRLAVPEERAPIIAGNLLLYFLGGLLFLSLITLTRHRAEWQLRGVTYERRSLEGTWLRATGLLLAVVFAGAVVLPFGLAAPLFGPVVALFQALVYLAAILSVIPSLLFGFLLSPLARLLSAVERDRSAEAVPQPEPGAPGTQPFDLAAVLVWAGVVAVLLVAVALVARRAGLLRAVVRAAMRAPVAAGAVRALLALARWVGHILRGLRAAFRRAAAEAAQRLGYAAAQVALRPQVVAPLLRLGPRYAVLAVYLLLVRQAAGAGLVRREAETASEFSARLERALVAQARLDQEVEALTRLFNEARYSAHAIGAEHARRARGHLRQIREALRLRRLAADG